MSAYRAVIGLGSNLGDRLVTLERALESLDAGPDLTVVSVSPVYETEPVGGPPQGSYLNAAALVEATVEPQALMRHLLAIEEGLGRVRSVPNAPRTIDLDLLWVESLVLRTGALVIPHPRLYERAFALQPLIDVAPDAIDPRSGEPMRSRLSSLPRLDPSPHALGAFALGRNPPIH